MGAKQLQSVIVGQKYPALQTRIQTLKDVEAWMKIYEKQAKTEIRAGWIFQMIVDFRGFCDEYIRRLSDLQEMLDGRPQTWLESAIDSSLLEYWLPICRAAKQYQVAHWAAKEACYSDLFEEGYKRLDMLQMQLEEKLKLKLEAHFVLYFEKIGKAKRYPFGDTYLIGIPQNDAYAGDWNALPHELGHHLFWNTRFSDKDKNILPVRGKNFLGEEINNALKQANVANDSPEQEYLQRILDIWTEEIFADVVGAKIAQTDFIEAAWDRVVRKVAGNRKKSLFQSDGSHPIPFVLPYIRAFAAQTDLTGKTLAHKWKDVYGDIRYSKLVLEKQNGPTISIHLDTLCSVLKFYVENILQRLDRIGIDKIEHVSSPVVELENFIRYMHPHKQEKGIFMELLKPVILERGQDWLCWRCGKWSPSGKEYCVHCNARMIQSLFDLWTPQ